MYEICGAGLCAVQKARVLSGDAEQKAELGHGLHLLSQRDRGVRGRRGGQEEERVVGEVGTCEKSQVKQWQFLFCANFGPNSFRVKIYRQKAFLCVFKSAVRPTETPPPNSRPLQHGLRVMVLNIHMIL